MQLVEKSGCCKGSLSSFYSMTGQGPCALAETEGSALHALTQAHGSVQDDELLDSDEDNEEKLNNAKELAGMRVRHDADELGEGETMILTLADRNILDEHGEVDEDKDELENALVVRSCACLSLRHPSDDTLAVCCEDSCTPC